MILCTVGDSFTYGHELPDPASHAWPTLLAQKLGYQLINLGKPGVGNDYIIEATIDAVVKHKPDLLIIAWTSASRMQFHDENGSHVTWPGHFRKSQLFPYRNEITNYITKHNNEAFEYRDWLIKVILLQSFLKQHNVDYRFANTFDNQDRNNRYLEKYKFYVDQIDTEKFLGWPHSGMVEWCYTYPKAPGGHPLEEGHAVIADSIFTAL